MVHFIGEATAAQRGKMTSPRAHSRKEQNWEWNLPCPWPGWPFLVISGQVLWHLQLLALMAAPSRPPAQIQALSLPQCTSYPLVPPTAERVTLT